MLNIGRNLDKEEELEMSEIKMTENKYIASVGKSKLIIGKRCINIKGDKVVFEGVITPLN